MSSEIVPVNPSVFAIMPVMDMTAVVDRRNALVGFVKAIMVQDTDYGRVPGTNKDTLLKPGAEKLVSFFGLTPVFEDVTVIEDFTGAQHNGEPLLYYREKCKLYRGEMLVATADGSANSWEEKYRYRRAERVCPNCGQAAIMRSKYAPKDQPSAEPGWYCNAKAGGCGGSFPAKDPAIVNQVAGRVPNPNPADLANTILKMAQKRALVAATLIAVNASEFFTQDVEDMGYIEGNYRMVDDVTGEVRDAQPASVKVSQPVKPVVQPAQPTQPVQPAQPAHDDNSLTGLWARQAKNYEHAPRPTNGTWGACQDVIAGIVGGSDNRHRFYGLLFGREIGSANDLSNAEAAWLLATVKPHKTPEGWHANEKAEGMIVTFWTQHGQVGQTAAPDQALIDAAAANPASVHAPKQEELM